MANYTLQKSTPGRRRALKALAAAKRRNKARMARGLKPIVGGRQVSPSSLKKNIRSINHPLDLHLWKIAPFPTLAQLLADEDDELIFAPIAREEPDDDPDPIDYGKPKTPRRKKPIRKHTPGGVPHDQLNHDWTKTPGADEDTPGDSKRGQEQNGQRRPPAEQPAGGESALDAAKSPTPSALEARPQTLNEIIGQDNTRERLDIMVEAAKERGEPLDHLLFTGPPGLGKTTFARAIANEMGTDIKIITGNAIRNTDDMSRILAELKQGDILFIDEIHAIPKNVQEMLYPAMEDFEFDYKLKTGDRLQALRVKMEPFTLIGATTNPEGIAGPMRDRFGAHETLDYYDSDSLAKIADRTAQQLGMDLPDDVAQAIGERGRGTPRLVNRMVRRVNDFVIATNQPISVETADEALTLWGIDNRGLTAEDRQVLNVLRQNQGRAVGLSTLAQYTGDDPDTIHTVIEPFLLRQGLIERTHGGRIITDLGIQHLEENSEFEVAKHFGPGNHPSGSSQAEHGGGRRSPAQQLAQSHLSVDALRMPTGGNLPSVHPDHNVSGTPEEGALLDKLHFLATDMHMIDSHAKDYVEDHPYIADTSDPFWYQSEKIPSRKSALRAEYDDVRRKLLAYRLRDMQSNPERHGIQKHGGPGPHANGSPQSAHGVRGSATVPRLASASKRGFTVDNRTGETPKTGFAVALPGYEATTTVKDRNQLMEFISKFRAEKWSVWEDTPNAYFGGWLDNISKELFLDVTIVLDNKEDAIALGRHYNQKAIYDLGTFTEIRLDQAEAPVA